MTSSTFHQPAVALNDNYQPLRNEHFTLQYYFKELFKLMDNGVRPIAILQALLENYLEFPRRNGSYRVTAQHTLVQTMVLELKKHPENTQSVFQLLNESNESIDPQDDLIWLLTAYCSVFPYVNRELTNPHIKNALTIRDINNIYFHTVLEKSFAYSCDKEDRLYFNKSTVQIALATNQYEKLLEKLMSHWEKDSRFVRTEVHVLKHATRDQIEKMVLPVVVEDPLLEYAMPIIISKASPEIIETQIVPLLLEISEKQNFPKKYGQLLMCIKKMSVDALKRSCYPLLASYCLGEEKQDAHFKLHEDQALKPFLTIITQFSEKENDEISKQLIGRTRHTQNILEFLKELRNQNVHVNEEYFKSLNGEVHKQNEKFLESLENKNSECKLYHLSCAAHMTKEQVQRFFDAVTFEDEYENILFLKVLTDLNSLPSDIYPNSLRAKAFQFLLDHRNTTGSQIAEYLKKHDFSRPSSRQLLIDLAGEAMDKVLSVCSLAPDNFQDENYFLRYLEYTHAVKQIYSYRVLLETCVLLMTEKELIDHIIVRADRLQINLNKINNKDYFGPLKDILQHAFVKINQPVYINLFANIIMKAYLKSENYLYEKPLSQLVNKLSEVDLIYICRQQLIKTPAVDNHVNYQAYVLALIFKKNKAFFHDIPGFCTGEQYDHNNNHGNRNRFVPEAKRTRREEAPCVMM